MILANDTISSLRRYISFLVQVHVHRHDGRPLHIYIDLSEQQGQWKDAIGNSTQDDQVLTIACNNGTTNLDPLQHCLEHLTPDLFTTQFQCGCRIMASLGRVTGSIVMHSRRSCHWSLYQKLKKLSTWNEWKKGGHKQLNQFHDQKIFGSAIDPVTLPKDAIILRPH